MARINNEAADVTHPEASEIEEARKYPGGWIYRIAGIFGPNDEVPREAVIGAWQVSALGEIVGSFRHNPNYDPARFPGSSGRG